MRMKMKVPGPVAGRKRDGRGFGRRQLSRLFVEFPDEDLIEPQIDVQHEASGWVGLDHVRVRPIVATEGEASGRSILRPRRAELSGIVLDVGRFTQSPVRQNRQ